LKVKRVLTATLLTAAIGISAFACGAPASGDPVSNAIHQNFGDNPALEAQANKVVQCESGRNPNAYNPSGGYYGLFQLSRYWHEATANAMGYSWNQIYDPYVNARVARVVFNQAGGWGPWSCPAY
jgi:hypothetical protein